MGTPVSVTQLQQLVSAGKLSPQDIAAKVQSGEIELHDDRGAQPEPKPTMSDGEAAAMGANAGAQVLPLGGATEGGLGAVKGGLHTLYSLAKMTGLIKANPDFEKFLEPQSGTELAGKMGEQAAEFVGGEGLANAGLKAVGLTSKLAAAPKVVQVLGDVAKGATVGGGVTAAQGGDTKAVVTNATLGGMLPAIFSGLGKAAEATGTRMENSLLRTTAKDAADGYDVNNVFKYRLGGGLQKTAEKTTQKIEDLSGQLKDALQQSSSSGQKVDMLAALSDAENDIRAATGQGKNFSVDPKALDKVVGDFTDRINAISPNGAVDPLVAQNVKREVGNLGAWQYGARDPDANAVERVSNAFYSKLRARLEGATGGKAGEINQQLSEILPIERALIRRIPVAERNNILNLGRVVLLGTGHPGLIGLEMAAKSGNVANALVRTGQAAGAAAKPATSALQSAVSTASQ